MDGLRQSNGQMIERVIQQVAVVPRALAVRNARIGRPLTEDELQDVTQSTFLVVLCRLKDYRPLAPIEAWIQGICKRQFKDAVRNKWRRRRLASASADDLGDCVAPPAALDASVDAKTLLQRMGGMEATVVRLKHLEGLTFQEVAERLRISPNTAKTLHYRGLVRLRDALALMGRTDDSEGHGESDGRAGWPRGATRRQGDEGEENHGS